MTGRRARDRANPVATLCGVPAEGAVQSRERWIMRRALAFVFALVLVVAACGDDAGGGENTELVESLTEKITESSDDGGGDVPFDDEQAACFAGALIEEFGADRMAEAVTMEFDEFMAGATDEERLAVIDSMFTCVDFAEVLAAEFSGAVSAESAECLADAFVGSEVFRDAMADSFGDDTADPFDDPDLMTEMLPAMLECLSAEELVELGEAGG